ncbi:ULK/ULK protein kinase [Sphaeroforma arctica JP610]|uniref:non-specific serine/threonine protein kinase n=1 Tax=Sphaeroforma arctica JP610 TaxID=667725 RepID=A0A0L0FZJ1_9EUKA|nr:ULK/ULK protein kinase [Sphaeroforma arctica JP610]KNC82252.1 ULK/ULK protein kinase [Sphaeroforma arctica JP610]|eukprot:XP_014156154.1 ULK/ULK protein kinase [Sphaeroforma arctica JP610]
MPSSGGFKQVGAYAYRPTVDKIGQGSFATVYKAKRQKDDEIFAIKRINTTMLKPRLLDNLELEIQIMTRMSHPNIVGLYDEMESSEHMYLVMEFCEGGDLSHYIQKRNKTDKGDIQPPMGLDMVRAVAQQIGSAVIHLSKHNIIHRDIKPQNVLIQIQKDGSMCFKVADFGFARYLESELAATLCGSPLYMAPEILASQPYGWKADLWSIGTVLYECLTGRPPFTATNHIELANVIRDTWDKLTFPDGIDEDLRDLLHRLLQRDPALRMTATEFYAHPFMKLEQYEAQESVVIGDVNEADRLAASGIEDFNAGTADTVPATTLQAPLSTPQSPSTPAPIAPQAMSDSVTITTPDAQATPASDIPPHPSVPSVAPLTALERDTPQHHSSGVAGTDTVGGDSVGTDTVEGDGAVRTSTTENPVAMERATTRGPGADESASNQATDSGTRERLREKRFTRQVSFDGQVTHITDRETVSMQPHPHPHPHHVSGPDVPGLRVRLASPQPPAGSPEGSELRPNTTELGSNTTELGPNRTGLGPNVAAPPSGGVADGRGTDTRGSEADDTLTPAAEERHRNDGERYGSEQDWYNGQGGPSEGSSGSARDRHTGVNAPARRKSCGDGAGVRHLLTRTQRDGLGNTTSPATHPHPHPTLHPHRDGGSRTSHRRSLEDVREHKHGHTDTLAPAHAPYHGERQRRSSNDACLMERRGSGEHEGRRRERSALTGKGPSSGSIPIQGVRDYTPEHEHRHADAYTRYHDTAHDRPHSSSGRETSANADMRVYSEGRYASHHTQRTDQSTPHPRGQAQGTEDKDMYGRATRGDDRRRSSNESEESRRLSNENEERRRLSNESEARRRLSNENEDRRRSSNESEERRRSSNVNMSGGGGGGEMVHFGSSGGHDNYRQGDIGSFKSPIPRWAAELGLTVRQSPSSQFKGATPTQPRLNPFVSIPNTGRLGLGNTGLPQGMHALALNDGNGIDSPSGDYDKQAYDVAHLGTSGPGMLSGVHDSGSSNSSSRDETASYVIVDKDNVVMNAFADEVDGRYERSIRQTYGTSLPAQTNLYLNDARMGQRGSTGSTESIYTHQHQPQPQLQHDDLRSPAYATCQETPPKRPTPTTHTQQHTAALGVHTQPAQQHRPHSSMGRTDRSHHRVSEKGRDGRDVGRRSSGEHPHAETLTSTPYNTLQDASTHTHAYAPAHGGKGVGGSGNGSGNGSEAAPHVYKEPPRRSTMPAAITNVFNAAKGYTMNLYGGSGAGSGAGGGRSVASISEDSPLDSGILTEIQVIQDIDDYTRRGDVIVWLGGKYINKGRQSLGDSGTAPGEAGRVARLSQSTAARDRHGHLCALSLFVRGLKQYRLALDVATQKIEQARTVTVAINQAVQQLRDRYNSCLAKAEKTRAKLIDLGQMMGIGSDRMDTPNADKLIFDYTLNKLCKDAAANELLNDGENANRMYKCAVWLLLAVLTNIPPDDADGRTIVNLIQSVQVRQEVLKNKKKR